MIYSTNVLLIIILKNFKNIFIQLHKYITFSADINYMIKRAKNKKLKINNLHFFSLTRINSKLKLCLNAHAHLIFSFWLLINLSSAYLQTAESNRLTESHTVILCTTLYYRVERTLLPHCNYEIRVNSLQLLRQILKKKLE